MLGGVILAGGKSSRMGTDKSLLTWPDSQQSLLEHCQKQLNLLCNNTFVSGSQHELGIADVIPNCGPLSGIHGAITHIEMNHTNITELLVVAVDMPDVSQNDLSYLLESGRKNHSLCSFEHCFLPLYIPLSVSVSEYLADVLNPCDTVAARQLKQRQYSVKMMLDRLQGSQIPPLTHTQLDNINTPEQWQKRCAQ